jgi:WD40 repeat protein
MRMRASALAFWTLGFCLLWLVGCAAPRAPLPAPGPNSTPGGTRGPPTAPIARIEPGGHTAPIVRIDTDAAGRILVTGSHDKTVRLWSLTDGSLLKVLRVPIGSGDEGKVYAVAISPDGHTVAAGGRTGYEWDGSHSIYLFDVASGRLIRRLPGLPGVIDDLAWSPDGQYLAAGLGGANGVRIYGTSDWEGVYTDADYGDDCYSVDFASDGRLVTTSRDGYFRLYALESAGFRPITKEKAPGGREPYTARFSPNGKQIAVGFHDTSAVNVLDGQDLAFLYAPEMGGVDNGNLFIVAWSRDGRRLYAGGRFWAAGTIIRHWEDGGRGPFRDVPVSQSTIMGLESLEGGRLAYGAQDPAFGVLDVTDRKLLHRPSGIADLRDRDARFFLSPDGRAVRFGLEYGGARPVWFSLDVRHLDTYSDEKVTTSSVEARFSLDSRGFDTALSKGAGWLPPRTEAPGIRVTDWCDTRAPKLNGKPLALRPYETSFSLAVHPNGTRFLLGTHRRLRYFDADGRELWNLDTPSVAWGVNIADNGNVAVAAFGDGTLRWYRLGDDKGEELLALFPHPDGKRWVLWNPDGFFDAAPDAEDLVGFHLNRGPDQAAEFVAASQLADLLYRPDLVTAYLDGNEKAIAEAQEKGALARFRTRDLGAVLASGLPPEVELLGPTQVQASGTDFRLRFRVTDRGGGIGRVEYRVNGTAIEPAKARLPEAAGPEGSGVFSQDFTLAPGSNRIEPVVYNEKGTVRSSEVAVEVQVSAPAIERPALHVLAVGIDQYRDSDLALQYAAGDAKAFADTLVRQGRGLFAPGEVIVRPDRDATRTGIDAAFERLSARVQPGDVFVFYLAGHGRSFDGRYHFLPSETITRTRSRCDKAACPRSIWRACYGRCARRRASWSSIPAMPARP